MKNPLKIVMIIAAILVVVSLMRLGITGLRIGWGPFSFLHTWDADGDGKTWDGQRYADELFIKDGIHLNHEGQLLWMRDYIRPMIETLVSEFDLTQVQKEG